MPVRAHLSSTSQIARSSPDKETPRLRDPLVDTANATPVASHTQPVAIPLRLRWLPANTLLMAGLLWTHRAVADEPRRATEPVSLRDSAVDLLAVADAFDQGDAFDLNLRLAFDHTQRRADVHREMSAPSSGGYLGASRSVATYKESTQRLIPEVNIGLFRDLALTLRLPIILAYDRQLASLDGSAGDPLATAGSPGLTDPSTGAPEQLFSPDFRAPTRSGIEYLAVGLDVGLMNQFRRPSQPNWVIGLEGRFNVAEPMHACNAAPASGEVDCAAPSDIDRDGKNDPLGDASATFDVPLDDGTSLSDQSEGTFSRARTPGVSRGTHALELHTYISRRLRYLEPYTGVAALFELPADGSDFRATDFPGVETRTPPARGSLVAGLAIIPWEHPEQFSRLSVDLRFTGTYVSRGRDYSELFDPLGSSAAQSLRYPNFSGHRAGELPNGQLDPSAPSVIDPNSQRVSFTGLTEVEQHADYKLQAKFTWQAGRYVRFDLAGTWRIIAGHLITLGNPCNAAAPSPVAQSGTCLTTEPQNSGDNPELRSSGTPNPDERRVINTPGQRFRVDTSHGFSLWVRVNVLF